MPASPSLEHPLLAQVAAIASRARWMRRLHATSLTLIASIAAILLAIAADWYWRPQDRGIRWLFTLSLLVAATLWVVRWLLPAWRWRPSLTSVAMRIEARFPSLGDRLSSAVELLGAPLDAPQGSVPLRRLAVHQAQAEVAGFPIADAIRTSPARRATGIATVAILLAVLLALTVPQLASTGLQRLLMPWQNHRWPQQYHLQLQTLPKTIFRGDDLSVTILGAESSLPADTHLLVRSVASNDPPRRIDPRLEDNASGVASPSYPKLPSGDDPKSGVESSGAANDGPEATNVNVASSRAIAWVRSARQDFEVRAVGGDDQAMAWQRIEVRSRPTVVDYQWQVTPPAYSGQSADAMIGQSIEVLAGTTAALRVVLDQPIDWASARPMTIGSANAPSKQVEGWQSTLDPSGTVLQLSGADGQPMPIDQPQTIAIDARDRQGLSSELAMQWTLRIRPDRLPTITLVQPASDLSVTPQAMLELKWEAKDDFAVKQTALEWTLPEGITSATLPNLRIEGSPSGGQMPFSLEQIPGLTAGQAILLRAVATDVAGQTSQSVSRRLLIVTTDQAIEQLSQQQADALRGLQDVLRDQRSALQQTESTEKSVEAENDPATTNQRIQAAIAAQRASQRRLREGQDSVEQQLQRALEAMRRDRLQDAPGSERLPELAAQIERLANGAITQGSRQLDQAQSAIGSDQPQAATEPLREAQAQQQQAITELERITEELARFDALRQVQRTIAELAADQQRLREATEKAQANPDREDAQADRALQAQQQRELTRRTQRTASNLQQLANELSATDPNAAAALQRTAESMQQSAVAEAMRQAAEAISNQQLGEAIDRQQAAMEGLRSAEDTLRGTNSERSPTDRQLQQLEAAAEQIEQLQDTLDQAAQAQANPEAMQQTLQDAAKQAAQLRDRIEQQMPRQTGARDAMDQAKSSIEQGAKAAGQSQPDQAEQATEQAQQQVKKAKEEVEKAIDETRRRLAEEQIRKLASKIEGLMQRQQAALEERTRLRQKIDPIAPDPTRIPSVRLLAEDQRQLAGDVDRLAEQLDQLKPFVLALSGVREEMLTAAAGLDRVELDGLTQLSMEAAIARLQLVAQAVAANKPKPNKAPDGSQEQSQQDEQDQEGPTGEPMPPLAAVRLIRGMQQFIHDQTKSIDQSTSSPDANNDPTNSTATLRQRQRRLSQQQKELSDLLLGTGFQPNRAE
jgi:hypothetical protein